MLDHSRPLSWLPFLRHHLHKLPLSAELEVIFMSLHSKAFPSLVFLRGDFSGTLKGRLHLHVVLLPSDLQASLSSSLSLLLRPRSTTNQLSPLLCRCHHCLFGRLLANHLRRGS